MSEERKSTESLKIYNDNEAGALNADLAIILEQEKIKAEADIEIEKARERVLKAFPELFLQTSRNKVITADTNMFKAEFKASTRTTFNSDMLRSKFNEHLKKGAISQLPNYVKLSIDRKKLEKACQADTKFDRDKGLEAHPGYQSIMAHSKTTISGEDSIKIAIEKKELVK